MDNVCCIFMRENRFTIKPKMLVQLVVSSLHDPPRAHLSLMLRPAGWANGSEARQRIRAYRSYVRVPRGA